MLDQRWSTQFRIGRWESGTSVVNEGSQFPNDAAAVDHFIFQDLNNDIVADHVEAWIAENVK